MDTFGQRLIRARKNKGLSQEQLADSLGVGKAAVSHWETGKRTPDITTIHRIIELLGIDGNYLFDLPEYGSTKRETRDIKDIIAELDTVPVRPIPILGSIPAGCPAEVLDEVLGWKLTPVDDNYDYFALYVKGDSMSAAGLDNGDLITIRCTPTVDNGSIVVAKINMDDGTVKKFYRNGNIVQLVPHSHNDEHQPQIYDLRETDVVIVGEVISVEKMLKK